MGIAVLTAMVILSLPLLVEAKTYRVGVSPLVLDLGTVDPGSRVSVTFFVVTSSEDEFLVQMIAQRGNADFFDKAQYTHLISNYSQEDASSWIKFLDNPVVLQPGKEIEKSGIRGSHPVNFILEVPTDAEPGYHNVLITPTPAVPEDFGTGATIVTQTSMTLLFNVPGEAIRQGKILDITRGDYTNGRLELNIYFQNTGTVTIFPQADLVEFFDVNGNLLETTRSNGEYFAPDELIPLKAYVVANDLEDEEYLVNAEASYITGFVSKDAVISLAGAPPPIQTPSQEQPLDFPWWVFLVPIIIVIAYWYYRR